MLVHTCFLVFCWRAFLKLNLISTFLLRLKPKSQLETISRYFIFLNKCIKRLTSPPPPPPRASELPRPRSVRGPPEPLRPPREQPHPGALRPAARPPPPLPQESPPVTSQPPTSSSSSVVHTLGMTSGPCSPFRLLSDRPLRSYATLPPCGRKWYLLHRDRLAIQTGEPAGGPAAFKSRGKNKTPEDYTLKSSTSGAKHAANEVCQTFCLQLISWCVCVQRAHFVNFFLCRVFYILKIV